MTLEPSTVSLLIGQVPSSEQELRKLSSSYGSGCIFKQIVFIDSTNLVQMCNFIRRCRRERQEGKKHAYLVFMHFVPHRETWHFLDVYKELGITLVLYDGLCVHGYVRELFVHASYLLQYQPVLSEYFGFALPPSKPVHFVVRTTRENIHSEIEKSLNVWKQSFMTSADQYQSLSQPTSQYNGHTASGGGTTSNNSPPTTYSTSTMSFSAACALLQIDESRSNNLEAIRHSFKRLARACHPDKQLNEEDRQRAHDEFARLNEAKSFLEKTAKR